MSDSDNSDHSFRMPDGAKIKTDSKKDGDRR